MEEERDKAEAVKQHAPILVVLGNPPYNGFAGLAVEEERDLVEAYRKVDKVAPPQGQGLNDLYVRFYRMAERRITEGKQGEGIVCFISNYSWLDGLSFTGMRERFLDVFDHIWIDCLNGDKYKTGKLTPEGEPDPSVFSTEHNREGIQVGTAIALLARAKQHESVDAFSCAHFWGRDKLTEIESATGDSPAKYAPNTPTVGMGLTFATSSVGQDYFGWPRLTALFPVSFPGVKTSRDDALVDIDRERLVERMDRYFDTSLTDAEVATSIPSLMTDSSKFSAANRRRALLNRGFLPEKIVRYGYRPFDNRWLYWEPETRPTRPQEGGLLPARVRRATCGSVTQQMPRRRLVPASSDHAARVPRPDGSKRKSRSRPPEFGVRWRGPRSPPDPNTRRTSHPRRRPTSTGVRGDESRIAASRRRCTSRSGVRQ